MTAAETKTYPCPQCKGRRRIVYSHRPARECDTCQGGTVTLDREAIKNALMSTQGRNKGRFRRSRPKLPWEGGVYGAAYCWRMIRFHTGRDMTMPMAAPFYVGNPGRQLTAALDAIAESIGAELFGDLVMMRGGARWHGALTGDYRLADALGVGTGTVGTDIGGIEESPEYWAEQPAAAVADALTTPALAE